MPGHTTHLPHGSGVRGLSDLTAIDSNEGRFGRLFPDLAPAEFAEADLLALAEKMTEGADGPKDGPDDEESHIPGAYTYLGQFIDHDLTFDPSTFAEQKSDPKGIVDFRTPRFDLDNVYGRGPGDQPFLYDGIKLLLGEKFQIAARNPKAFDVPRAAASSKGIRHAIIGDPRNDENVIVSQLQGMLLRFHNRLVDLNPGWDFDRVQQEVRWHYQWVVLHDFLPLIVRQDVLDAVSPAIADPSLGFGAHPAHLRFYKFENPVMPVEYSVAAYRLGHSMVRPGYRLNEHTDPIAIFNPDNPPLGLNGFGAFPPSWAIDWQRLIDLGIPQAVGDDKDRIQMAYKMDTSLVNPLAHLPKSIAGDEASADPRKFNLAFRNLLRGEILRLPSGQDVATKMGVPVLGDDQIVIGRALTPAPTDPQPQPINVVAPGLAGKCPLWAYVLAEARAGWDKDDPTSQVRLGPVGGTIVAETFLALLRRDRRSFLRADPHWKPSLGDGTTFTLADLLNVALQG